MNLKFAGVSVEGHPVVDGLSIFKLKDEIGFPFSMSFTKCEELGWLVDWVGLLKAARDAGWPDYRTLDQIEEAFTDSGAWRGDRKIIIERLQSLISAPGVL